MLLVVLLLALWRLDEQGSMMWALATGVLILPYTIGHALLPQLPAAKRLSRVGPLLAVSAPFLALAIPAPAMLVVLAGQLRVVRGTDGTDGPNGFSGL